MSVTSLLAGETALPHDAEVPVFEAPWEAQVYAPVVRLFEQGHRSWPEWVACLSAEIAAAKQSPDRPQAYYEQPLAAAEKLITAKGLATPEGLAARNREMADSSYCTGATHLGTFLT
jgi:nitrile hydratase accessory protein